MGWDYIKCLMVCSFSLFDSLLFTIHYSLPMMYFLATLITVFLVAAAALLPSNSEDLNLASLPSLDSPFSGLFPLGAATADNDQSLNVPDLATFSSQIAQLPGANSDETSSSLNFLDPATFSSQNAQLPGANSDETSSITDPSTIDMCHADGSTGQNVQKREGVCREETYFLLRPELPKIKAGPRTEEEVKKDGKATEDKDWYKNLAHPNTQWEDRVEIYYRLYHPGRDWCTRHHGSGSGGSPLHPIPVCCLGPPEFVVVPTLGSKRVRRHDVTLMNEYNCLEFILGRPFCMLPEQRYCCKTLTEEITDWGFKALDCVFMDWETYPTLPVRLQAEPSDAS